jgi:hypothetical protein
VVFLFSYPVASPTGRGEARDEARGARRCRREWRGPPGPSGRSLLLLRFIARTCLIFAGLQVEGSTVSSSTLRNKSVGGPLEPPCLWRRVRTSLLATLLCSSLLAVSIVTLYGSRRCPPPPAHVLLRRASALFFLPLEALRSPIGWEKAERNEAIFPTRGRPTAAFPSFSFVFIARDSKALFSRFGWRARH